MMGTTQAFSASEAMQAGWQAVKKHLWFFIGVCLATWLGGFVVGGILSWLGEENMTLFWVLYVPVLLAELGISLGLYAVLLKTIDGKKPVFKDLLSKFDLPLIINYFLASLLSSLVVFVGFLLLIIPGIILALRLGPFCYIFAEKSVGPIEALKLSWKVTKGNTTQLFVLMIYTILLSLSGLLLFGVGLLVTTPLTLLAMTYAYRKMSAVV